MTATASYYFSTGGTRYCTLHGTYYGTVCPSCSTSAPYYLPQTIVTSAPSATEEALAATVKVLTQLINDLRAQVAERDRQIEELRADLNER